MERRGPGRYTGRTMTTEKKAPREPLDVRTALGLAGVLAWLASSAVVGHAHDMMLARRDPVVLWTALYEIAAGYVLGFVAALCVAIVVQLGRGPVPELMTRGPWLRALAMMSLLGVLAIALAGLVMQNMGGASYTYDAAFLVGLCLMVFGVLPLYRRVVGELREER